MTAMYSWWRMAPPPPSLGAGVIGAAVAADAGATVGVPRPPAAMLPDGPLPQPASFSSQSASSEASPPGGRREPDWVRVAAQHLRPAPPDAPIPSATGSRSAASVTENSLLGWTASWQGVRQLDPRMFALLPLAVRTQSPASQTAERTS